MELLKEYLMSITAAAIICGIVNALAGKKSAVSSIVKLLASLFLALTVIRPVAKLSFDELEMYMDTFSYEASAIAAQGENIAARETASIIKSETEAYILDKAASLEVDLEVEVILSESDHWTPVEVHLCGAVSPYAKAQLAAIITDDLGIPKEAQRWSG